MRVFQIDASPLVVLLCWQDANLALELVRLSVCICVVWFFVGVVVWRMKVEAVVISSVAAVVPHGKHRARWQQARQLPRAWNAVSGGPAPASLTSQGSGTDEFSSTTRSVALVPVDPPRSPVNSASGRAEIPFPPPRAPPLRPPSTVLPLPPSFPPPQASVNGASGRAEIPFPPPRAPPGSGLSLITVSPPSHMKTSGWTHGTMADSNRGASAYDDTAAATDYDGGDGVGTGTIGNTEMVTLYSRDDRVSTRAQAAQHVIGNALLLLAAVCVNDLFKSFSCVSVPRPVVDNSPRTVLLSHPYVACGSIAHITFACLCIVAVACLCMWSLCLVAVDARTASTTLAKVWLHSTSGHTYLNK